MRQTACRKCGHDIEGSYRKGWWDRGAGTHCLPPGGYDQDGVPLPTPKGKHQPVPVERAPQTGRVSP